MSQMQNQHFIACVMRKAKAMRGKFQIFVVALNSNSKEDRGSDQANCVWYKVLSVLLHYGNSLATEFALRVRCGAVLLLDDFMTPSQVSSNQILFTDSCLVASMK